MCLYLVIGSRKKTLCKLVFFEVVEAIGTKSAAITLAAFVIFQLCPAFSAKKDVAKKFARRLWGEDQAKVNSYIDYCSFTAERVNLKESMFSFFEKKT